MKNIVSITQPDFFPWIGSFKKIELANTFVFLDHVTNRPNDGIWTKRVKILIGGKPKWLSIPLKKDRDYEFVPICDMLIDTETEFTTKHLGSIKSNYLNAPFFKDVYGLIEEYYALVETKIANRNIYMIKKICELLGLKKDFLLSSEMNCASKSNELLIEIVKKVNGTHYIFGEGSLDYLKPLLWEKESIVLEPQNYIHPVYQQYNSETFIPGLSIIDVLMNCGFEKTKQLLAQ